MVKQAGLIFTSDHSVWAILVYSKHSDRGVQSHNVSPDQAAFIMDFMHSLLYILTGTRNPGSSVG